MEGRILKLQELANERKSRIEEFEIIRKESLQREEEKRNAEYIDQQIQKVPLRFRGKTFVDYLVETKEQAQVKALAERYTSTFKDRLKNGTSMVFYGKPGTGKTLLSLIIYQALAQDKHSVKYESTLEFIKNLIEIKFKSQSSYESAIAAYSRTQFLILDEISESVTKDGTPSETEKQILFQLINKRYEEKLCTLIVSNRDMRELKNRLGEPIMDRLTERGITLAFNWNSFRQK